MDDNESYPPKPLTLYEAGFRLRATLLRFAAEVLRAVPLRSLREVGDTVAELADREDATADEYRREATGDDA